MSKNLLTKIKRGAAMLLSGAMMITGLPTGFVAHAATVYRTEMEPDVALMDGRPTTAYAHTHYYSPSAQRLQKAASYGNGSTTSYKYGFIRRGASGFDGWKFDINGLIKPINNEPGSEEAEGYVISDRAGALSSTYPTGDPQGYTTQIGLGPTAGSTMDIGRNAQTRREYVLAPGNVEENFHPGRDGEIRNGEVVKVYDVHNVDMELEVRLSVKPSPDKKYILAEYTVHNTNTNPNNPNTKIVDAGSASTDGKRTVWFATGTDIMIAGDDWAPAWATEKGTPDGKHIQGIHAQGNNGNTYTLGAFDILTYHPQLNLGIPKRDGNDTSKITTWIGHYGSYSSNYYTDLADLSYMPGGTTSATDSGTAYSLKFDLLPGETKTGTIAFSMRGPTYYVDPESQVSAETGFISSPFKSIQSALNTIGTRSPQKVFIFMMNDETITQTLEIPAGKDVTIQTTDYVMDSTTTAKTKPFPIILDTNTKERTNQFKIIRDENFTGDMFKLSDPTSNLTFSDIIIDGNKDNMVQKATGSLVKATAGNVMTQTGAIFQNNEIVMDSATQIATVASAIDISGSANLKMDSGKIMNNKSYQGGAVNIEGSGEMSVANAVLIKDNVNEADQKSNVRLGTGKIIQTTEALKSGSSIGISTVTAPASATEEVPVAAPSGTHAALPYSASQFPADKGPAQWTQMGTGVNARNVVLKASQAAYSVSHVYEVKDNSGVVLSENTLRTGINENRMSGSAVNQSPESIPSYVYSRAIVSPTGHGLSVNDATGNIIGSMPGMDISIKYVYVRDEGVARFLPDGGTPANITPITSPTGGAPTGSMPTVSKTGYTFAGWYEITDPGTDLTYGTGDDVLAAAATTALPNPVQRGEKYYKAVWNLDGTGRLYEITHKNSNPSLPLTFKIDVSNKAFMDVVRAERADRSSITPRLEGYVYSSASANPSNRGAFGQAYEGVPVEPAGSTTAYVGKMPLSQQKVVYTYRVDTGRTFPFSVEYVTTGGADLGGGLLNVPRNAEAAITASPRTIPGYTLQSASVVAGGVASDYVVSVYDTSGSNPFDANRVFNGRMPNQPVTIRYTYSSNGGYELSRRYMDSTSNQPIGRATVNNYAESAAVNESAATKYGYTYGSTVLTPATTLITVSGTGAMTGTMPPTDVQAVHSMNRDLAYWKNMNFAVANAPFDKGTISTVSPIQFLIDNPVTTDVEAEAHTFGMIKGLNPLPTTTGNPSPYYKFIGWYLDAAATQPVTDSSVFQGDVTLYAKFDEDPDHWVDVNFVAGANGSITSSTPVHTWKGHTWADIASQRPTHVVPNTTPNYEFDKWTVNDVAVTDSTVLLNGATYVANFRKIASIWGLNVGDYTPIGRVGSDGSGEIKVTETQVGNVYIVSDMDGNIVAVMQAPTDGTLTFTDLLPGTRYHVQEGTSDTQAVVGQPISSITGTSVSTPKEVLIPTVEDNYGVGVDPLNEGMAQIVINPADPDSDYALIDEDGNVVLYPTSDNGWMTPVGSNPSTVTFSNLIPGNTYRVVARKKGDTSVAPLDKINEGTDIHANPGDMVEAPKFIVETLGDTSSEVVSVNQVAVSQSRFEETKIGDTVVVKTNPTNATGQNFKYWKVLTGRNSNIPVHVNDTEFSFVMQSSNVVLRAVYERDNTIVPSNAAAEEEIRGGARGEFGLNPDDISALEDALTAPDDETLMDINGADVTYKIVFNKRNARANEVSAVKAESAVFAQHPTAFSAAWALDVFAERYVDGRLVSRATPSNATARALVQLPNEDTDMLDYELWDVPETGIPTQLTVPVNPENTAGLFSFDATIGHKYVLVYSKTFKLRFIDNNPVLDFEHLNDTNRNFYHVLKVRRGEAPTDTHYAGPTLYGEAESYRLAQLSAANVRVVSDGIEKVVNFTDVYGTDYTFVDWSRKNMPDRILTFDPDAPVLRAAVLYAYYDNNKAEVAGARTKLATLVTDAERLKQDPYLLDEEITLLDAAIQRANARIAQKRGELLMYDFGGGIVDPLRMAIYKELKEAIDDLENLMRTLNDNIAGRRNRLSSYTGGRAGGGGGTAGRGTGSKDRPLQAVQERIFSLGVDGHWEMNKDTQRWSFVLQGGLPLNNTWGKIQYADPSGKLLTKWYFFDNQASMVTGWYHDSKANKWYYMDPSAGISNGQMVTGWFKDTKDNHWYYLDPVMGEMYIGWHRIGDKWYYFAPVSVDGYPKGSLYVSTTTPDGYRVNHDGEWIQ